MGVVIAPESELGKELAKWEKPYVYVPFPKMVYRAIQRENGKIACGDPSDEQFSQRCQLTVRSEDELRRAQADGWRESPTAALAYAEGLQRDIANAAAERHFADQRLSEKAREEAKAADDADAEHVADIAAPRREPRRTKVPVS